MRLLAALILLPLPALGQTWSERNAGEWQGPGVQPESEWQTRLFLYADGAVVDYPDLGCAGWWTFTHVGEDDLSATEHLAAGFDLCIDGAPLSAQVDAKGVMTVFWAATEAGDAASAWLQRR